MTKNALAAASVSIFVLKKFSNLQDEKSILVKAEECVGCESCVEVCEEEIITVTEI